MAFTAEQLSYAGKAAMDFVVRKSPEDLYNTERPLLKALNAKKKTFPGAKQYINEKLRISNDSNFQWFGPDGEVTYNRKRTLAEANFAWASAHDGFGLTEEELLQNYITVTDDRNATPTTSEQHQFVNLITENTETLKLGFNEKFDYQLHLDGTQDAEAIPGLDALISTTPATGTVGGISRVTYTWWRNQVSLNIASTTGLLQSEMNKQFRNCTRIGGSRPDLIIAGTKFIDAYKADVLATQQVNISVGAKGVGIEGGVNDDDIKFKGIPIQWDPVMDDLQAALDPTVDWDKRCYFINTKTLKLRPAEGQDMVTRRPPRVYNRYTHYWGVTWRGSMTITNPGANAVLSIA
jgi:hypothetical protein